MNNEATLQVPQDVIVHAWKGGTYEEMMEHMRKMTATGHQTIMSSCWSALLK